MDIEKLAIGVPFYVVIVIVLVAALYPAAKALDRGRMRLAIIAGLSGLAANGAYLFAIDRFAHGYDGMMPLLVWPIVAIALSAIVSTAVARMAGPRA